MEEAEGQIKRIHRPFWFVTGLSAFIWIAMGAVIPRVATPVNTLFEIAALTAFGSALLFILVYTLAGFVGPKPRPKWWHNEVGTYLILFAFSRLLIVGPTAFAIVFNNGLINTWWWAWIWIGGHVLAAVVTFCLVWIWFRNTYMVTRREA